MNTYLDYFYLFICILILFCLSFIIGRILLSFYDTNRYSNLTFSVFSTVLGTFTIIFLFSLLKSKLHTIHILFIPIIIFYIKINSKNLSRFNFRKINFNQEILPFIIFSLIIYFYQLLSFINPLSGKPIPLLTDVHLYSNICANLNVFGSENFNYTLNFFLPHFRTELLPYRYSDLWLAAFSMEVFKTSELTSYYLITCTYLISVLAICIYSKMKLNSRIVNFIITLIFLFISIIFIPKLNPIEEMKYLSETNVLGNFKQKLTLCLIAFFVFLELFKSKKIESLLILVSIPILYVSYIPSIWGSIFIYLIFLIVSKKTENKHLHYYLLILLITLIIGYLSFFKVYGSYFSIHSKIFISDNPIFTKFKKLIFDYVNHNSIKILISTLFTNTIPEITRYIFGVISNLLVGTLFLLPFFLLLKQEIINTKKILYLIITFHIIGLIFLLLKHDDVNNYQFYTNNLSLLTVLFTFLFSSNFHNYKLNKRILILTIIILGNIYPTLKNKFQKNYINSEITPLEKTLIFCKKNNIENIFCFVKKEDFSVNFNGWAAMNEFQEINQLNFYKNGIKFSIANSSIFFIKNKKNRKSLGLGYDFSVMKYWLKNKKLTEKEILISKGIKYVIAYPNAKVDIDTLQNYKNFIFGKLKE